MKLTKMVSGALAAALMATTMYTPAFAAEADLANGDYTGTIHFLNGNGSGNKSRTDFLCSVSDSGFCRTGCRRNGKGCDHDNRRTDV